jgi:Plasmid stabilisation system protein.
VEAAVVSIDRIIADSYHSAVKEVRYGPEANRMLRRHGNMAARIDRALRDYAENPAAHANNVRALKGSDFLRLRVGDYRVIFLETATTITVIKIGPRGSVYE